MEKRNIPKSHLLKLSLSLKERMSREEYDRKLKEPVLAALSRLNKELKIAPEIPGRSTVFFVADGSRG